MPLTTPESITAAREAAGITRYRLARLLGTHHTTVLRWETGERTPTPAMRGHLERTLRDARRRRRRADAQDA